MKKRIVVGVDLAGVPRRPTSICILNGLRARTSLLFSDHELDAVTAAYTGLLCLDGKAEVYGDFETGAIVMPPSS